jgi:uncharacterized peroxidase-related enzyme
MAFIRTIPPSDAAGPVREMYERAQSQLGYVPNWAQAFSLRPHVMDGWVALLRSIRDNLSVRRYELATLAAARALRSSYCALAHGSVLADQVFSAAEVTDIITGDADAPLDASERDMMAFVEKVVRNAHEITRADLDALRSHGYGDDEIFDVTAAAAARCFFSTLLDALGAEPDSGFHALEPTLKRALSVGRAIADQPISQLPPAARDDAS